MNNKIRLADTFIINCTSVHFGDIAGVSDTTYMITLPQHKEFEI